MRYRTLLRRRHPMRWKCTAPATRRGGMGTIGTGTGTYLAAEATANEVVVHSPGHQKGGNGHYWYR
jgi:hypothetical protein